ncbi:MAG: type II toxin-antitoxin system VapC family toxin [Anaerolineales bacterium]|nr:type II toxin-antitoxin system VapC family toxin [Anaerolineales bacterium]
MTPEPARFVLDSYALLAFLADEPGRVRVENLLTAASQGHCQLLLCLINLGEILYLTERRRGLRLAQKTQAILESLPIEMVAVSRNLVLDAAHIKAQHAISYADAFVVALAQQENATILTGDPEFQALAGQVALEWLAD